MVHWGVVVGELSVWEVFCVVGKIWQPGKVSGQDGKYEPSLTTLLYCFGSLKISKLLIRTEVSHGK